MGCWTGQVKGMFCNNRSNCSPLEAGTMTAQHYYSLLKSSTEYLPSAACAVPLLSAWATAVGEEGGPVSSNKLIAFSPLSSSTLLSAPSV